MQPAHDCHHKNVIIDGKNFRTVTDECWDIERRLEAMALHRLALGAGIGIAPGQLFSPDGRFSHCLRINTGHHERVVLPALHRLGELARELQGTKT